MVAKSCCELLMIFFLLSSPLAFCQNTVLDASGSENQQAGQTDDREAERWNLHFQATSIAQHQGSFYSEYAGPHSLPDHPETRVSLTATVFASFRLTSNFDVALNPELAGGEGFGGVTGIAGFTNGEIPRVNSASPISPVAIFVVHGIWAAVRILLMEVPTSLPVNSQCAD